MCCCLPFLAMSGGGGGQDFMEIAVSALVPYLHAVPGILAVMEFGGGMESEFVVPYIFGNIFYAFVSTVILSTLIASFEEMVGRTGHRPLGPPLRNPSLATPVPAGDPPPQGEGN